VNNFNETIVTMATEQGPLIGLLR